MPGFETDRNLLFGVLALQGDLIDSTQFVEACSAWAAAKDRRLAELLRQRDWITADDERLISELLERKVAKHAGDAHRSLIAAAAGVDQIHATIDRVKSVVDDREIVESLAGVANPHGFSLLTAMSPANETRERYKLTTLHAKGGIGQVWVAHDESLDREVALKELRPERSGNPALVERFVREAAITGRLDHPGVVPVYELSRSNKPGEPVHPFYTMRLIRGRTLSQAVVEYHRKRAHKSANRTDLLKLLQAYVAVCHTVAYAHSRGVIHRDLKGMNIVIGEFGEVILLDWGLAKRIDEAGTVIEIERDGPVDPNATAQWIDSKSSDPALTTAGEVLGTPAYMAPEQAEGSLDRIGTRTDVYGLGAMLYEILTGKPPFEGESNRDVIRKVREENPVPPRSVNKAAPKPLQAVCLKAMQKAPEQRYRSAADIAADVQHWLADEPVSAYRDSWVESGRRWISRNRTTVATVVAGLCIAAVALGIISALQAKTNRDLTAALDRESMLAGVASDEAASAERVINEFYSGIGEDVMLRRPELTQLRQRMLERALGFYEQRVRAQLEPYRATDVHSKQNAIGGMTKVSEIQAILGQRDRAIETRQRAIELAEQSEGINPEIVARHWLDLGNLQRLAGRPKDAEESLRESLRRYKEINAHSAVTALAMADLGRVLYDTGNSSEAVHLLEQARELQEQLTGPEVKRIATQLPGQLAASYTTLGNIHESENRRDRALENYQKATSLYEKLLEVIPGDNYFQAELARSLNNLGLAKATAGQIDEGRADLERGKGLREALFADQPLNTEYQADLARSYYHIARADMLAKDRENALRAIEKATELYKDIPPKGPEDTYFQACMTAMRGALASGAEAERFNSEAIELLKKAMSTGYANLTRLKNELSLDILRDHADFQALLKSIEASRAR